MVSNLLNFALHLLTSSRLRARVAVLVVFLLGSHSFLCALGAHLMECDPSGPVPVAAQAAISGQLAPHIAPVHQHEDVCCKGVDEKRLPAADYLPPQPSFTVTYALWALLLTMLVPLVPVAVGFGKDGTDAIPDLSQLLLRACLPHRAPPVFLA